METKVSRYKENRELLKELSAPFKALKKEGAIDSINSALIEMYKEQNPEIKEFKTFNQWIDEGKKILKGSKAYLVWGSPRPFTPEKSEVKEDEQEEQEFFPLCYLFSNLQTA